MIDDPAEGALRWLADGGLAASKRGGSAGKNRQDARTVGLLDNIETRAPRQTADGVGRRQGCHLRGGVYEYGQAHDGLAIFICVDDERRYKRIGAGRHKTEVSLEDIKADRAVEQLYAV